MTPWTITRQAPLSRGFPGQKYWSEEPFPFPGDLPTSSQESNPRLLHARGLLHGSGLLHASGLLHCRVDSLLFELGSTYGKESACQCRRHKRCGFNPWVRKIPWRRKWQPIPVFLPGKFHGQRNLVGYSPWSCKESDTTKQTDRHRELD